MSHYSVKPVDTSLQPSRLLFALLVCMHITCLLVLWGVPLSMGIQVGCTILLLASGSQVMLREFWRPRFVGLHLAVDGVLSLCLRNGLWQPVQVLDSSFVTPWLVILHVRVDDQRAALLLLPDMLAHEDFRRLRVWLRWWRPADA